jgi:hypothetical protein
MSNVDCPDCPPDGETSPQTQAQPATKTEMASVPVQHTLAGPNHTSTPSAEATGDENSTLVGQQTEVMLPPDTVYPNIIIEFCDRCRWYVRTGLHWNR